MSSADDHPATDRREFAAGDLDLELELPTAPARRVVVLVPGVFATAAFFRVDADAGPSPARWLREKGCAVVHFDQRGLGRNRDRAHGSIDLTLRVADLRRVVLAAQAELPQVPMVLLGHSFGGATIYALLASGDAPTVNAAITVGSPARLTPRAPPWENLFSPETEALARRMAAGGFLDAVAFATIQNRIYSGGDNWARLPRVVLALGQWAVARWRWLAATTLAQPHVASFLFRAGPDADYSAAELQRVLRARAIEREHLDLLLQVLAFGRGDGEIALPNQASLSAASHRSNTPVLAAWSARDELVLPPEVAAWASPTTSLLDVGACGHGGYFFKAEPRARLLAAIETFLEEHAS